jgi:hypothetical protein
MTLYKNTLPRNSVVTLLCELSEAIIIIIFKEIIVEQQQKIISYGAGKYYFRIEQRKKSGNNLLNNSLETLTNFTIVQLLSLKDEKFLLI